MMMICVGYLFPAVAADGMTVEYAQREPEAALAHVRLQERS